MRAYADKEVLVTGGTGLIGSRLTEKLTIEERANVTVLVHEWKNATKLRRTRASLVEGDVTKPSDVNKAVKGKEVIFHCVGIGGSFDKCREVNVEGTRNLLDACKKQGVRRIVYLSTASVHGPRIEEGLNEDYPFRSFGYPYPDSKIEAEKLFWKEIHDSHIEGTVIRPTYVWGPNSIWFTIQPIQNLLTGNFFFVDEGKGACNAVYIDNVVDLLLIAGWHPNAVGEAFLCADGERLNWHEFFNSYAKMAAVDTSSIPSLKSSALLKEKIIFGLKHQMSQRINRLAVKINRSHPLRASSLIFTLEALKKSLGVTNKLLNHFFPQPCNPWELMLYSSPGFVSMAKPKRLLSYSPTTTVSQGMRNCALWLKDHNYIP